MPETQTTPEVLWAQRSSTVDPERNYIHLTVSAPDVPEKSAKIDLKPTSVTFTGRSDSKHTTYHVELQLYGEIDVENSKTHHTSRDVEFVLRKKELNEEYWPRLLKDKAKVHFLKTNFDKWVDEDEQDAAPEDDAAGGMGGMPDMGAMGGMGGMGGMPGMGGMGGMGGDGGFGGIDFSKLGGGAGGMPDMGDMPEDGDDDDDDAEDMPGLEGDEAEAEGKGKGKEGEAAKPAAKIEEVS